MREYSFEMLFAQGGAAVYGFRRYGCSNDNAAVELAKQLPACHTLITPDGTRYFIREIKDTTPARIIPSVNCLVCEAETAEECCCDDLNHDDKPLQAKCGIHNEI